MEFVGGAILVSMDTDAIADWQPDAAEETSSGAQEGEE